MKTYSVSFRMPEDLYEFVKQCPGKTRSDKLVKLLRSVSDPYDQYVSNIDLLKNHVNSLHLVSELINNLIYESEELIGACEESFSTRQALP